MDNETLLMLDWVNSELDDFRETLEQVKAHIMELETLKAELSGSPVGAH